MRIIRNAFAFTNPHVVSAAVFLLVCASAPAPEEPTGPRTGARVQEASDEGEKAIKQFKVAPGLKVELFAAEPLLADPVSFSIDEQGRFYVVETFRLHAGVGDIRGRVDWEDPAITKKLGKDVVEDYLLNEELASTSHEESIEFLKRHYGPRAAQLSGETDRIRLIEDRSGSGKADHATVFASGFDQIGDGLAAGVIAHHGKVWMTDIPNLWELQDTKGTGTADVRKQLLHGFGVRVGFLGHDLHGLRFGPDGKLYFSIGDRGGNIKTPDGRHIYNPEYGCVYRCNPDGTELEIFHYGLRNPQELVFDKCGNLWTGDNNSDAGDPARWVYCVEGGDSGWRVGYQFIEQPNARGPWLAERQCYPDGEGAFRVPPIAIIADGPSGLTYDPGIGLPERYREHFFLCDFRGQSSRSGVHSFKVEPDGAGFKMVDRDHLIWNILVTDVDFGYDGCVYVSDWVSGWGMNGKGRIYRVFDPETVKAPIVEQTKKLVAAGFDQRPIPELVTLLSHPDQRVRQDAQFALVDKGADAVKAFTDVATKSGDQLARIHAMWGLGQLHAKKPAGAILDPLIALLTDKDPEIRAQAARALGNGHVEKAHSQFVKLLEDANLRTRFFAAMGVAKLKHKDDVKPILAMIRENADRDAYLRHAGVMALQGCADVKALETATKDPSAAIRMASLLTLRLMNRPEVALFLHDREPKIVLEAARAINDTTLTEAMPQLALLITESGLSEPLARRVLNANFRLGGPRNAVGLASFAADQNALEKPRIEALQELGEWAKPHGRDKVMGLWRPLAPRDPKTAAEAMTAVFGGLLTNAPVAVRVAAIQTISHLEITAASPLLMSLVAAPDAVGSVRVEALKALAVLHAPKLSEAVQIAVNDPNESLRKEGRRLLAAMNPGDAVGVLDAVLKRGTTDEKQSAFGVVATIPGMAADEILSGWMDKLLSGKLAPELKLDLLDAAAKRTDPKLKAELAKYDKSLDPKDPLAAYRVCLTGGNAADGKKIFFERPEASCVRCHKVHGEGGDVGPVQDGIGTRQNREYMLESIVYPNAKIAPGFESVIVATKTGAGFAGVLKSETADELVLSSPEDGIIKVKKADIVKRDRGLSGMPEGLGQVLSKRDLRDLVEFLASLKQ